MKLDQNYQLQNTLVRPLKSCDFKQYLLVKGLPSTSVRYENVLKSTNGVVIKNMSIINKITGEENGWFTTGVGVDESCSVWPDSGKANHQAVS